MIHEEPAPQSGKAYKVSVHHNTLGEGEFVFYVEDWWDRLTGKSWKWSDSNPAALWFAMRTGMKGTVPTDDEVLYGHLQSPGGLGMLIHVSELEGEVIDG